MCGIAGLWHRDGRPVSEAHLRAMAALVRHRGPDGEGIWRQGDIGFSHRRLAIIDPTPGAQQPMATPDARLHIVFNGEIHNYLELRAELEGQGVAFQTRSDTEVALWAYRTWGAGCFERFNGMWAVAFWDADRETLLLCRDRFGIRPLYYSVRGPRVAFASEAKSIVEALPEERIVHATELGAYLRGSYPDCGETTFFQNIRQVRPGEMLAIGRDREQRTRYWRFEPGLGSPPADPEAEFLDLFRDAVRLRLRSDAPVGILVSGGLDSSAVAQLALQMTDRPLHTFSLRYEDPQCDESHYARLVVEAGGAVIPHWIEPPSAPLLETIRAVTWHHDAPCPSRARYAAWHLLREASRHIRVALGGDGSDEMLAGYTHFILPAMLDRWQRDGKSLSDVWREARELMAVIPGGSAPWRRILIHPAMLRLGISPWPTHQILHRDFARGCGALPLGNYAEGWVRREMPRPYEDRLNNALWHEFTWAGLPETMHCHDAIGMAFAVETRAPLLDHRIVEFLFRLPGREKVRDGWTKSLLRRAFKGILPEPIRTRRPKLGFPAPLNAWFKDPAHTPAIRELLLDGHCVRDGVFDRKRLARQLTPRLQPGRPHNPEILWRWLSAECWYRDFIGAAPSATRPSSA